MAIFPLSVVVLQFYNTFTCGSDIYNGFMAIGVALEAFLESFLQLVLQVYTIMYGYDITNTQIVTISASFFILAKASIDLDLEMYRHELDFREIVMHYLKLTPGYSATIAFRVLSFSVTIAFLRLWSIIPISLLMIELSAVCYICFRKLSSGEIETSAYLPLIITNLGVSNVGMIGANEFMWEELKQAQWQVNRYYKETNKFIKLSSAISFLHHTTTLSVILALVSQDPNYFEHWGWPSFIIKNYGGYFYDHMYWVFALNISMGIIGLSSSLQQGAMGLKIVILVK